MYEDVINQALRQMGTPVTCDGLSFHCAYDNFRDNITFMVFDRSDGRQVFKTYIAAEEAQSRTPMYVTLNERLMRLGRTIDGRPIGEPRSGRAIAALQSEADVMRKSKFDDFRKMGLSQRDARVVASAAVDRALSKKKKRGGMATTTSMSFPIGATDPAANALWSQATAKQSVREAASEARKSAIDEWAIKGTEDIKRAAKNGPSRKRTDKELLREAVADLCQELYAWEEDQSTKQWPCFTICVTEENLAVDDALVLWLNRTMDITDDRITTPDAELLLPPIDRSRRLRSVLVPDGSVTAVRRRAVMA